MRQDRPQRPPNESGRDQLDPQPPSLRRKEPSPAELQQHIQDPATPNIFNHFLNIEDVLHQKKCTHCGKKFNRKRDLRIHVRSCLGDIRHDESPEEHHPQNGPSRSDGFYGDNDMNGHNNVAINPPGEATTTEPAVSFDPQPRPSSGSHGSSPSSITDEFLATESLPENIIQIQQESSFHHVNQSLPVSDNSSESALPSFQSSQEVGNDVISSHVDPSIHDRSQSPPSVDDGVHETFTANDSSDSECWTETGRDFNVPINRSLEIQRPHNQETVSSQETVSTEGRESDWLGIPESETTDSAGNHDVLETDNNDRNGLDAQKEDESSPDFTINPFEEPHDFGMFSGNYDILLNPLGFHEQNRFIVEAETPLSHDVPPPSGRQIHTEARLYNPMLRGNQSTYYNLAQQRQGPQGFHPRQNEGAAFGYPNGPPSFFANNTQPLNRNATVSPGLFPLFYPHQQGFSSVSHNQGPSGPHVSPPEDADDDETTALEHPTGVPSMAIGNRQHRQPLFPNCAPPPSDQLFHLRPTPFGYEAVPFQPTVGKMPHHHQGPFGLPRRQQVAHGDRLTGQPSMFASHTQPRPSQGVPAPTGFVPQYHPRRQVSSFVGHQQRPQGSHVSPPEDTDDDEITVLEHPTGVPSMAHQNSQHRNLSQMPPLSFPKSEFNRRLAQHEALHPQQNPINRRRNSKESDDGDIIFLGTAVNDRQPLPTRDTTAWPVFLSQLHPRRQGFSSVSHNQGPSGSHGSPPEDADDDEITVLDHPTGVPSMTHSNSLQNRPPVIGPPPGFDKISATSDVHRSFVSHADNTAIFNNEATDIEAPSLGFNDGQQFWPPVVIPPPGFENIPASYDVHLHQDEKPSLQQGSVKEESSSPLKSAPHFVAVKDEDAERKLFSSGNDPSAEYSAAYAVSYDDDDAPIDVNLAFLARRSSSRTRSATKIYNPDYIPYMSRKRRATKRSPRQINDHDGDVKPTVFKRGRGRPPKIQDDDEVVDAKPFSKKSRSAATRRPRKRPASPSTVPLSPQKIFKTVASLKAEKKPELDEGDKLVAKYKKDQEQLTPEQLAEVQAAVMETGRCRPEHITLMDESALQEISKKLKTKAAKVTSTEDFCKDDLVWEVDSVIRVTMKREIAQDEKVFLVSWKGWGMAYCTLISLLDLQGAPDVLNEYYLFATGVEAVLANFRTFVGNHPASLTEFGAPKRLPLRRIDAIFRIYMSDQELLALFKKNKSLAKMFSLWIWKILEKRWKLELEKLYGEPRDVLRVECFFAEALSRAPINFTFITENVFSQAASEEAAALFKTPRGCKCNAHTGFCAVCRDLGLPHPECRLEGNKMVAVPRGDAKHKRSHCAVLCGEGSLCPPDAPCRKLPLRDNCLLVTFSPKIKGLGVFALSAIKKHTVLVEYTGEVMTMREANVKCRNYQFDVTGTNLSLDARVYGNESRFVNHSCEPNVGVVVVYTGSIGAYPRIYYATLRDIVMGEELFVDYHPDLVDHPNPAAALTKASECFCGTPSCRGVV